MNVSELHQVQDGDEVVFTGHLPALTVNRKYKVRKTLTGCWITDDSGRGRVLNDIVCLNDIFERVA